jgi:hypothetical protein
MKLQLKSNSLLDIFKLKSADFGYKHYCERLSYQYSKPQSYISIFNSFENKQSILTHIDIKYSDKIKLGAKLSEVKKSLRIPYAIINNSKKTDTKIIICKIILGGKRAKLDMHFCNNKLFYFSYTFSYLHKQEIDELKSVILHKYLGGKSINNDLNIKDKSDNVISVDDSLEFKINYLSTKCSCYNHFLKLRKEEEFLRIKKQELQFQELYANI